MRIKAFTYLVDENAKIHTLQNTSLVIDAQNFFYEQYENSQLNYHFGAECDRYADYLKNLLDMFKKNNVKCFFVFKGGTKNLLKKIEKDQKNNALHRKKSCNPIFMNDIHLQVLEEMGFDYIFTEFEAKRDCIALARQLSCPVLSMDIQFAFSGVPYIPKNTLNPYCSNEGINCKIFSLSDFRHKYSVDKNKIAIFILLSDESIFPENSFVKFYIRQKIAPYPNNKRHVALLRWLSKRNDNVIQQEIFKNTNVPKDKILEELTYAKTLVEPEIDGPVALDYRSNNGIDSHWFEKGVALNFVPKPYIDVYRSNILLAKLPENRHSSMKSWLKIIKYAYDLLTNFRNDGMQFLVNHTNPENRPEVIKESVRKPNYQANLSVFENGWDHLGSLNLFQHFMIEEINFKFDKLKKTPAEANLLLIALVYFHKQKTFDTTKLTYSVLLSYIMLGVVKVVNKTGVAPSVESVSSSDCKEAACLLDDYFKGTPDDISAITDEDLLDSVYEFEVCLREINNLNRLCGKPFEPTVYGRTFNGTFVHMLLHEMQSEEESKFFEKILWPAPTVLYYLYSLFELYQSLL